MKEWGRRGQSKLDIRGHEITRGDEHSTLSLKNRLNFQKTIAIFFVTITYFVINFSVCHIGKRQKFNVGIILQNAKEQRVYTIAGNVLSRRIIEKMLFLNAISQFS